MIDLVAQGPVYRGHKLARIIDEYANGHIAYQYNITPKTIDRLKLISTKGWARLDVRIFGNPWGLSVSDIPAKNS